MAARLAALPTELSLADGSLRVINLYRLQGIILHETAGAPADSAIERLVREVYAPYGAFWTGYLGDERAFRRWSRRLLARDHAIHSRIEPLLDVALDRRFTEGVDWIVNRTGRRPEGTWYILFGPGWTDMGGMPGVGMLADFTRMQPDSAAIASLLPHELTHQVHGRRGPDPDAGTVLERMISEGFASYVSWIHADGARTPAQALGYTGAEWSWSLEHEQELLDAVADILDSRERRDSDRIAARSAHLIPGAPGAAGYFLGFRIVQSYVDSHGPESWMDIYELPVREVLNRSRRQESRLRVQLVTDEADAVLHILELRATGATPGDEDWQRLFATEGYRRLKQREHSLQRPFEDSTFRAFAMSDSLLARAAALRSTLNDWRRIDPQAAALRAFSYLPPHAVVRARIYPVIKPRDNSFVFEPRTNPAIFLYLDPSLSSGKFENTLAHELHHIGLASACSSVATDPAAPAGVRNALDWMGAFAEGLAMLAAAGSADVHPHVASDARERAVWERDIANAADDMRRMEQFFVQLIDGELTEEQATQRGFTFINTDAVPQGAFYTVGWLMGSTIEKVHGRAAVVASSCDPRALLTDYQRAARQLMQRTGRTLPLWSDSLLRRLGAGGD